MTEMVFDAPAAGSEEADILTARMFELGAEGVTENENGFSVFWPDEVYRLKQEEIMHLIAGYTFRTIVHAPRNWNSEWEKNYPPVIIGDQILVHAPFHNAFPDFPYRILIHPGMAFGTGHHSTTALMLRLMTEINMTGKTVIDMGCGSGVLAIMASLLGASEVTAIDNDRNSVENTRLNIGANHRSNIICLEGDATLLKDKKAGIILANITRNILLSDFDSYYQSLLTGGFLIISGFLKDDLGFFTRKSYEYGMTEKNVLYEKEWTAAVYHKPEK